MSVISNLIYLSTIVLSEGEDITAWWVEALLKWGESQELAGTQGPCLRSSLYSHHCHLKLEKLTHLYLSPYVEVV